MHIILLISIASIVLKSFWKQVSSKWLNGTTIVYLQSDLDETQIQAAADDVELPTELAKMIAEDNQEEEHKQSVLGQLTNIQNVDIDQLKEKAQSTIEDLKQSAEKCEVM